MSPGGTEYQIAEGETLSKECGIGKNPEGMILLYRYKYNKDSSLCDFMFLDICTQRLKSLVR